ncbi:catalase [Curvibacter sp. APW13]|uniref:catalase n=1 Tax=Curvibacter sp. APW13 TaxID=3077236 RepID=UPI0028DDB8C6|nr:catalase [Curvibacter sp. APW13]MDT8991952.1 catalase [Curvibacter sp. APW13]
MSPHIPSTAWKEVIAPDEAQRFAAYAEQFAALQARKSKRYGQGRALHRKQLAAAHGTLKVLGGLPAFAAQGLFAAPGQFDVRVRLSNGGMDKASDKVPDVRGFALRVLGVQGDSALGNGPAVSQDFALINHEAFAFPRSDEFVDFVVAASAGGGSLMKFLVRRYGIVGAIRRVAQTARTFGKAFGGFAANPMYSAAPIACGPYAVRVRLVPAASNGAAVKGGCDDWGGEFAARLQAQDLHWELQLQPFVDEATTPIEDASVDWPTPYTTVARLTLPRQTLDAASALATEAEAGVFDPWQALAAHRPLGDVMRARKVVYYQSQKGRGAA